MALPVSPVTKTPENSAPWRPGHRTVAVLGSFVPLPGIPSAASLAVDMVLGGSHTDADPAPAHTKVRPA
ncbi:hypothetical protein [Streptomyces sp. NPDC053069]|uniref:hypothetical protein n=1 Tax=Streptomyces sp. NPDC053069 TaxID=3365695 RepID=UPI0037D59E33